MSAGAQIDYNALAKQAGALSSQPAQRIDYAALAKQAGGIDYQPPALSEANAGDRAAAQAHAETLAAIPTSQRINAANYPGSQTNLSPFTESGKRQAAIGDGYNEYMRQSGVFAGTAAGTMGAGAIGTGLTGATGLLARSLAVGTGAGTGAAAGGASPKEAIETGAMAAASQPAAEGLGAVASKVFGAKTTPAVTGTLDDEWRRINEAIGVKPSAIRIGENATDLSQAATMPGRALAKAGLTSEKLADMTPLQQQAAVRPIVNRAASDLNHAFQEATDKGTTFDVGESAFDVLKRIKGGNDVQQKAVDAFNQLAREAGIDNQREVTPLEARELRQALQYGARFGQGGDLSSLGSIRAELYRAVNRDLHDAVPGLQDLDQFYSDARTASSSIRNNVAKMATKAPEVEPTTAEKALDITKKVLPWVPGLGAAGYVARGLLRDLMIPKE